MSVRAIAGACILVVVGCAGDDGAAERPALERLVPLEVKAPSTDAWRLFDRSLASRFAPGDHVDLELRLESAKSLAAVKVAGPAAYRLQVLGDDRAPIAGAEFDLSALVAGWNRLALPQASSVSRPTLRLTQIPGATAPATIAELELWAVGEAPAAVDDTTLDSSLAGSAPLAGLDTIAAAPATIKLVPRGTAGGSPCGAATVQLARHPATLRRAWLTYQVEHVFRPFTFLRGLNGGLPEGGAWIAAGPGKARFVEPIDPELLTLGGNEVLFCLPDEAATDVAILDVRIVGDPERGRLGTTGAASVAPGNDLIVELDRLVAPDAIAMAPAGAASLHWTVRCRTASGEWQALERAEGGGGDGAYHVNGGGLACSAVSLAAPRSVELTGVSVIGSGARERIDWPQLRIASPPEHFGELAWIGGWARPPSAAGGPVRVTVDGVEADSAMGPFGRLLHRTVSSGPWTVEVKASFSTGATLTRSVVLDRDATAALTSAAPAGTTVPTSRPAPRATASTGTTQISSTVATSGGTVRLAGGAGVIVPAGAVANSTDLVIRDLADDDVPPLDPWLINVTAPGHHGFEFLPHGTRFNSPVQIQLPYDAARLPTGKGANDVNTYFYDRDARHWRRLTRLTVDLATSIVTSQTDHFTVMINAVLVVPESPQPLSYDPTSISSLSHASPAANVDLIDPPVPDSSGDARLMLPIRLPHGRGAYEPTLSLAYSSGQKDGWMGVGWDVPISHVEIDTRFGAPTYEPGEEPRYLLDSEAIVPVDETDGPSCRTGGPGRRYRPRVEGAFRHILRCGADASSFHFEVHDRNGALHVYGDESGASASASLASYRAPGGIFAWSLREVVDVHGNTTRFRYQLDDDAGGPGREPSRVSYPAVIDYTSHPTAPAAYHVEFVLDDGSRPDRMVDGRAGFKRVTRQLLRSLRVRFQDQIVRQYVFTYRQGQFQKSVLSSVRVYGLGGCDAGANAFAAPACTGAALFHEHAFDYYREDEAFSPPVVWASADDGHALTESHGLSANGHLYLGVAFAPTKRVSAGVRVGGTVGQREEDLSFVDVNGDGLVDQVFSDGTARFNQFTPGPGPGSFAPVAPAGDPAHGAATIPVRGLPGLLSERSAAFNTSVQAFFQPVTLGASSGGGLSQARRIIGDLDGDMFVDVLSSDGALRGGRCEDNTAFCFTPFALSGPDQVDARANPRLGGVQDAFAGALFLAEPVRRWVAPYTGAVHLTSSAQRTAAGGLDGVVVQAWKDDAQLGSTLALGPDNLDRVELFPGGLDLEVNAGDALYLKVGSVKDVPYAGTTPLDLVVTQMTVDYTSYVTPDLACVAVDDLARQMHEPTGEPVFTFDAEREFRLAGAPGPSVVLPVAGSVALRVLIDKQHAMPDDVRVCLQRLSPTDDTGAGFPNFTADLPCSAFAPFATRPAGSFEIAAADTSVHAIEASFDVRQGDLLVLRVESDFPVDPGVLRVRTEGVDGQPGLRYTQVCRPGQPCTPPPGDCSVLPNPRSELCLGHVDPFVPMPAARPVGAMPLRTFVAPADETIAIANQFSVASGAILAAIRSDRPERNLVFKRQFGVECGLGCLQDLTVDVAAGESLTFEFIELPGEPVTAAWDASVSAGGGSSPVPVNRLAAPVGAPPEFFSGGYRGWWFGAWNAAEPFTPGRLAEIAAADQALLADVRDHGAPDNFQGPRLPRLFVALSPSFAGAPGGGGRPAWVGSDPATFITDRTMHSARVGARSLDESVGTSVSDALVPRGQLRLSVSSSRMLSGGVSAGLFDGSFQIGDNETNTTTDIVDMNGDRIADLVTSDGVVLGGAGGRSSRLLTGFNAGDAFRHREGTTYSIGLGINPTIQDHGSSGRPLSVQTRMPTTPVGGGVAFSRTQLTEDLHDINGDGLPDRVRRSHGIVEVQYNLGSRFTGVWESIGGIL